MRLLLCLLPSCLLITPSAHAGVTLSPLFSDHAVLQRERPICVFGTATGEVLVKVSYAGTLVTTRAKNGLWQVELPAMKARREGSDLVVTGGNTVIARDVVVGDVWIGSGQSNMEFPVGACDEADSAVPAEGMPAIRLMTVPYARIVRHDDFPPGMVSWKLADPKSVAAFSATAWYAVRRLQKELGVPIGVITASMGATEITCWLSQSGTQAVHEKLAARLEAANQKRSAIRAAYANWQRRKTKARQEGKDFSEPEPYFPPEPFELYATMVRPLSRLAVTGIIWYQGESDFGDGWAYRTYLSALISGWRHDFGRNRKGDELPFVVVQLPGWDRAHETENGGKGRTAAQLRADTGVHDWIPELRDAQWWIQSALPRVATACIIDLGTQNDRHPTRKREVGERVALRARRLAYGQSVADRGPQFHRLEVHDNVARVHFQGEDLRAAGDKTVHGFILTGGERDPSTGGLKWYRVTGRVRGRTVELTHPRVQKPLAVRYDWNDYPDGNLFGAETALPVPPFRSDDFRLRSAEKWIEP